MLKFKDFKYERPDLASIGKEISGLIDEFNNSQDVEAQNEVISKVNKIRSYVETMVSLVHIRHSIDTTDDFYAQEQDFMDENSPL